MALFNDYEVLKPLHYSCGTASINHPDSMNIKYTKVILITFLYISGIIFQLILSIPLLYILISTLLFIIFLILKKFYRLLLLLFFFLGLINTNITVHKHLNPDIHHFSKNKHLIEGRAINYPVKAKRFSKFLFQIEKIDNKKRKGIIQVFIKPDKKVEKNYYLVLYGKINIPKGPANFGEFDYGLYYERLRINGTLFINNIKQIKKIIPVKKSLVQNLASIIRKDIKNYIKKYYHPTQNFFLSAILIGERGKISSYIKEIFVRSGTIHLLAISGLHVGLLTFIFLTVFINLRIPRKISFLLILIFVVLYNLIVGYRAPILRSTLMFIALILCYLFDRDKNYLNSMSVAGFIILLIDPLAINSVSFQMSFLATAGIIIYTPVFNASVGRHLHIKNKIFHFFKNIFIASFSAQIFIFPILISNFKQFSYISVVTNLIAIPFTTIILFLSLLAYFFYHLIPVLALLLTNVSDFIIALMIYILNFFSKVPLLIHGDFNYPMIILYFCIIFLSSTKIFVKKSVLILDNIKIKYGPVSILIIIFLFGFLFLHDKIGLNRSNDLEVIFFNVKGKSVLIKTPLNKYVLIDAGYEIDVRKHILPFLKRNKINQIDCLILSNITRSRSQGIPYLLKEISVKEYMDSGYSSGEYRYERIRELISLKKIKYQKIVSKSFFNIDNIKFHIFCPPLRYFKNSRINNRNIKDNSLVLKIEYKQKSLLFCSDIKDKAVKFIIETYGDSMEADIINLPDLNRNEDSMSALLKHSRAAYATINKKFTYFENKDKEWIKQTLKKHDIKHYFTKDDGAIKVILNKNAWNIISSFN